MATHERPRPRTIAALGSSFAAGPTLQPVDDVEAMRSTRNYPHLLAEALGADLVDLTVSGATTANILHTPQQTMNGRVFAPQIDGLPAEADLVTITAGGNDVQFIGSMLFAAWFRHEPAGQLVQMLGQGFTGGLPDAGAEEIELAAAGLTAIVDAVGHRARRARVILVDYLTVVTKDTPAGDGAVFSAEDLQVFLRLQAALAEAYRTAADRSGAELLAMSTISADHGLGSDDPWVIGFQADMATTAGSFHPNPAGMTSIADHLHRLAE